MELQERIKNIENTIKSLQEELEILKESQVEPVKEPYKRWRAGIGEDYWYVVENGLEISIEQDQGHSIDRNLYKLGNYFQTGQEAQNYLDNLITKQELKDLALELNRGVEINWGENQSKYYIYYINNELSCDYSDVYPELGQVYCLDKNFLDIAKERIGEKRLIKLIKSGV